MGAARIHFNEGETMLHRITLVVIDSAMFVIRKVTRQHSPRHAHSARHAAYQRHPAYKAKHGKD